MTTRSQFSQIVAILQAAFPKQARDKPSLETMFACLKDLEPEALAAAALQHIRTSQFYPSVSDLRALAQPDSAPTAADAWYEVHSAIDSYAPEPEWSHPAIASAVRVFGGWQSFCRGALEKDRGHHQRRFSEAYEAALVRLRADRERDAVRELQEGGVLRLE